LSYNLKVVNKGKYLYVNVEGNNSAKAVLDYLRDVRDACLQHKCSKVLIEENLQGPNLKTSEIFDVVTKGAENMRPALIQVAFIDTNKQHDMELMRFAETVAYNRAINVKQFFNREDAEKWLLDK